MILTVIYKNGRILSREGVTSLDSRERQDGSGGFNLFVSVPLGQVPIESIPTEDLQQWKLLTDYGALVVNLSLKPGDLDAKGVEVQS